MKRLQPVGLIAALTVSMAGCSGNPSNAIPKITSVNPLSTGKLQFAVGTANLYGMYTGLNVVSTYRQSDGLSNTLLNTPTITGPFTLPASSGDMGGPSNPFTFGGFDPYSTLPDGPSIEEVALGGTIMGSSASIHPGTPVCDATTACSEPSASGPAVLVAPNTSTFGQAGGVFTNGIAPGNSTNGSVASSYVPYTEPMYDTLSGNAFVPFGGPPAFPVDSNGLGTRDGESSLGTQVLGIPLGITTFEGVTVSAGAYSLKLAVPTGLNGSTETYGTAAASAQMASTALLGTLTAPTLTLDAGGGASFTVASFPAGVTEELIEIVDYGDGSDEAETCQGALGATFDTEGGGAGPVYYTVLVKAPGNYTLPDTIGPNTSLTTGLKMITPSESLCTAAANTVAGTPDIYTVQAIGADYPLYEALYPNSTSQTPTLTTGTQADITISAISAPADAADAIARHRSAMHRSASTVKILRH